MNIDWSKAPEGATHYAPEGQGMREQWVKAGPTGEEFGWYSWNEHANCWSPDPLPGGGVPIKRPCLDSQEKTRQAIIDLAAKRCGIAGDSIRQLATVLAAEGYRKFEIVEEDV